MQIKYLLVFQISAYYSSILISTEQAHAVTAPNKRTDTAAVQVVNNKQLQLENNKASNTNGNS